MPTAFIGVIVKSNNDTANTIVRTCLTLPVNRQESASASTVHPKRKESNDAGERRTSDSHAQRPDLAVCREADDVETKRDAAIHEERKELCIPHTVQPERVRVQPGVQLPYAVQLPRELSIEDALDECKW